MKSDPRAKALKRLERVKSAIPIHSTSKINLLGVNTDILLHGMLDVTLDVSGLRHIVEVPTPRLPADAIVRAFSDRAIG